MTFAIYNTQMEGDMMNARSNTMLELPSPTRRLSARLEPFDSYWQAPSDIEKGYNLFFHYYKANIIPHVPADRNAVILVVSCGPGYLVNVLRELGYTNVRGIDSDPEKVEHAAARSLPCTAAYAFEYLDDCREQFDTIVCEQELNHLTHDEMLDFLQLCHTALRPDGILYVYGLNGANPIVGSENLAHNIDHFNTFTEYSLRQVLEMSGFRDIQPLPLKLYVFWRNPLNYVGLVATTMLDLFFRACFLLYGKDTRILTKKIAAVCRR